MKKWLGARITDCVGQTPIVQLLSVTAGVRPPVFAKVESLNPGGSIKDRAALFMCQQAAGRGDLTPGACIVECTSGNTGIGIALYAASHGHPCIVVMSDKQSPEKISILKAMGAEVVLCPATAAVGADNHYRTVGRQLAAAIDGFFVNQYDNPDNPLAHYRTTGPEIHAQMGGGIGALVSGVGTGGTISGTARYLREQGIPLTVIGVDAEGSVLAQHHAGELPWRRGSFAIEGIGDWELPGNIDFSLIDRFEVVGDAEAFAMSQRLLREEGLFVGGSSGAAVVAALRHAAANPETVSVLVLLPDSGNRYISRVFNPDWLRQRGYPCSEPPISLIGNAVCALAAPGVRCG